jgi:hypothetical protein
VEIPGEERGQFCREHPGIIRRSRITR